MPLPRLTPRWTRLGLALVLGAGTLALVGSATGRSLLDHLWGRARGGYTVAERLQQYGEAADARLRPAFTSAGLPYPPAELALLAFKDAARLELYARAGAARHWVKVRDYPVLAASGGPGPKLREGDRQVPEGRYRVQSLNPNSRFHLSLRLDYPNAFDQAQAARDGRRQLGGDIMIHGNAVSVGCLAMGDEAAEDLFVLAARVGHERVQVLISPTDFRVAPPRISPPSAPPWLAGLYAELQRELQQFPRRR